MHQHLLPLAHKIFGHWLGLLVALGVFADINFQNKVTLGSLLTTVIIIVLAGIFTIRARIATIWREEAEGERAAKERLQEELTAERASRAKFEKQQQELQHALKNEIIGLKAQTQILESRTDLTSALEAIRDIGDHGTAVSRELVETIKGWNDLSVERDDQTHELLREIRDKLPNEPIAVHEIAQDS